MATFSVSVPGSFSVGPSIEEAAELQDALRTYSVHAGMLRDPATSEFEVLVTEITSGTSDEAATLGRAIAVSALFDCGYSVSTAPVGAPVVRNVG